MSYVHFLDVFDPAGLPAGLSNREAAEQARKLRLSQPSPRLLALLTRIRQQPPGITVNVMDGQEQRSVEWVAGDPPRVQGEGAHCALWTLVLPVDEDVEELQEGLAQVEAWAKEQGLRVWDETQEAFAQPARWQAPKLVVAGPVVDGEELPGPGDILVMNWGPRCVSEFVGRPHNLTLRQIVQRCMARNKLEEINKGFPDSAKLDAYHEPDIQRLLVRLLEFFPFETHGQSHWGGRHPLTAAFYSRPGLRLLRVAPEHRTEVLKRLMPLARELFLTVVLHDRDCFVERSRFEKKIESSGWWLLNDLDPDWEKPRWTPKQREKKLLRALSDALLPHGFEHAPEKGFPNRFVRPLRGGGGQQTISLDENINAYVQSERLRSVLHDTGWNASLSDANVLSFDGRDLVRWGHAQACVWGGGADSPEQIAWAVQDMERLLLPVLDRLHTAQDLWDWVSQPGNLMRAPSFPGFSDLDRLREWSRSEQNFFGLRIPVYAARCLPDDEFQPLLRVYREAVEDGMLRYPNHVSVKSWLKRVEAYARMPRTSPDGPL